MQNASLITIAGDLGLFNTSQYNVQTKIQEIIDTQNFTKLIAEQDYR